MSAVINNSPRVAAATRERVSSAIHNLGYEPNAHARNLKRRCADAIAVVVPELSNPFFTLVAAGIEERAREDNAMMVVCSTNFDQRRERYYTRLLNGRRVDGVIFLSGTGFGASELRELAQEEPVVLVDEQLPDSTFPFVGTDHRKGALLAAQALLERAHRHLAVIAGPRARWTSEQRLSGYREAMAAAGLVVDDLQVAHADYRVEGGFAAAADLLSGIRQPSALLCSNDLMALGALRYVQSEGMRCPEDISIIGFDDIPAAQLVTPPLMTVRQDAKQIGRTAADLLLDQLRRDARSSTVIELAPELVERSSVGFARS